jgi:hypothetical protein
MEWITLVKGKEQLRVRPRGLDALLAQGWERIVESQVSKEPVTGPIDGGIIKMRAPKVRKDK